MKALSLTEPWATLVVTGEKQFETRSWKTSFRGTIAIHAAKGFPRYAQDLAKMSPFRESLAKHGAQMKNISVWSFAFGAIIGTVDIVEMIPTEQMQFALHGNEEFFGDYSPNRWAWKLANPQRLSTPIYCRGALSLWTVPEEIEAKIIL